jgi:phosphatidylserine/phosphatidylglycerophosphate/cardiolipin synthase-like enzyme
MKVIVQPEAGVNPILTAIKQARKSVDIVIFRLDRRDVANALRTAVTRGVSVRALIAHTNRGGEKSLRRLEMDLLEGGVTVSRTADDLVRYHGKMMIVDGRVLHLYGFNFTSLDITKSRSFGIVTGNKRLVLEASRLFAADFDRQPYTARHDRLIVSPANSRERLLAFIKGARRQLLIYDPQVSDDVVLKAITERLKSGVDIRLIGKVESKWNLKAEKYPGRRLHVRAIVRDGRRAFVGSQSLRKLELDRRREIGIIVIDGKVVKQIQAVFEQDWSLTESGRKAAKKAAKDGGEPGEPAARTGTYI